MSHTEAIKEIKQVLNAPGLYEPCPPGERTLNWKQKLEKIQQIVAKVPTGESSETVNAK